MEKVMFLRIIGLFTLLIIVSEQCEISAKHCSCGYIQSSLYVMCEMTPNNTVDIETALMQLENISRVHVQGGNFLPLLHRLNTSFNAVTVLDLSHCHQQVVVEKTTFKYCPKLEHIRLHDYNITSIEMGAFRYLQSLRILDLSDNSFLTFNSTFEGLMNLQSPNLTTLNISGIHNATPLNYAHIDHWMFKQLKNTTLEELDMSWTRLVTIETSTESVPYLKFLDLSGTILYGRAPCIATFLSHRNIETLKLDHWPKIPRGTDSVKRLAKSSPLSKREENSDCIWPAAVTSEGCLILPQPLKIIYFRFSDADSFYINSTESICFNTNNIETMIMSHMGSSNTLGNWKGLHKLKLLDLSHPDILRPVPAFSVQFFMDMPSLEMLLIPGTRLNLVSFQYFSHIFSHNLVIKYIDISNNYLKYLPPNLIVNNTFLEIFNVSFNQLEVFQLDISSNRRLTEIDLRYNNIRYFEENTLSSLSNIGTTLSVYLPTKSFDCGTWTCKYEDLYRINVTLICTKDDVAFVINSNRSKSNVSLPSGCDSIISKGNRLHFGWIIGIVCVVLIITVGVISVRLYRYNKLHKLQDNTAEDSTFITISGKQLNYNRNPEFVAFLSYSHLDTDFVIQRIYKPLNEKLKAELPQHNHISLILAYDKNFLPGDDIDKLIDEAVSKSCVTIAVVSNDFADSTWCHFEVQTAITANVPIIPIYLDDCDPNLFQGCLNVMYNTRVRLMWPNTSGLDGQNVTTEEDKLLDDIVKCVLLHWNRLAKGSLSESPSRDGPTQNIAATRPIWIESHL